MPSHVCILIQLIVECDSSYVESILTNGDNSETAYSSIAQEITRLLNRCCLLMNPSLGVVLVGAVNLTSILFLLISIVLHQCRSSKDVCLDELGVNYAFVILRIITKCVS
ncbi:hypothetical protein Ancab_002256 [Ancistrocladus abbreviatus]